jgi:DNA topoisomerase II
MSSKSAKKNGKKIVKKSKKTIEEKYQKIDQHAHVLKRPGMYIGSIKKETIKMWVINENYTEGGSEPLIISKEISYVPGFYKVYDEILVNARDHFIRCIEEKKEYQCTIIKVWIDKESGWITVWNNGNGVEIVEHKKHKMLVPSMIFGHLLSGANYNDDEKRKVGGTNGLGAKLTNIYSSEFTVETVDHETDKKFFQKWTNNMYDTTKAKVTSGKGKKPYTQISFLPDYEKFGLKGMTKDIMALFKKRVYDIAMTTNIKVYFNDELVPTNTFEKYIKTYFPDGSEYKKVTDISNENWRVSVVFDPTDQIEHENIAFVNGICTNRGGTHVDHVVNQVVNKLKDSVASKLKGLQIKPAMIKENLIFFIDSVIVNPEFDTQTKEMLKTKVADFGSSFVASDVFIKKIIKTGVVDQIVANAMAKADANLGKIGSARGQIRLEKLYNAHKAGTKEGYKCALILTEGDSAKGFAMSGLNVVGRDYYGVFPLKGKLLNVRDETPMNIAKNKEITAITKIMGLEHKKVYDSTKGLRYGRIIILTDQDVDGFHIKGLIMNFIHYFWPSLIKIDGFIQCLATPLIKATKGKGKNKEVKEFISMQEFDEWLEENKKGKGWSFKYYKGLGTSTAKEAQECFRGLEDKLVSYYWKAKMDSKGIKEGGKKKKSKEESDDESNNETSKSEFIDEENDLVSETYKPQFKDITDDAISLGFSDKRADHRKIWINSHDPSCYIDNTEKKVSIYDFIHKELLPFSVYNAARAIPSLMDGLKPGQRKVYCGSVKKNIYKNEIKVAQLSGFISEHMAYHHGEQSLNDTIINMAQNFVGSNNINLLLPKGQFGTRATGGTEDAASPRYIFTKLNELGKKIFIEEDYDILNQQEEDGLKIEPEFYAPIIPMILVNGAEGIGTGYSTKIKPCNPRDIYDNCKRINSGDKPKPMAPWYRHFTGTIEKVDKQNYISRAKYDIIDDNTIHISDLPIGMWTDKYKNFMDEVLDQAASSRAADKKASKEKSSRKTKGKGKKKAGSKTTKKTSKKATAKTTKKVTKGAKGEKGEKKVKIHKIAKYVKNIKEDCTDVRISFTVEFLPGQLKKLLKTGELETGLKLISKLSLSNMHLFDENNKIRKYETYGAILKNFARVRLELYQKRKDHLLGKWRHEMDVLRWKVKFIDYVIAEKIIIFKNGKSEKRDAVIARLEELKFPQFITGNEKNPSYNYITSTGLFHLTEEDVEKFKKELADKKEQIGILESKTPSDMWNEELDDFIEEYDQWEENEDAKYEELLKQKKSSKKKNKRSKGSNKQEAVEV